MNRTHIRHESCIIIKRVGHTPQEIWSRFLQIERLPKGEVTHNVEDKSVCQFYHIPGFMSLLTRQK